MKFLYIFAMLIFGILVALLGLFMWNEINPYHYRQSYPGFNRIYATSSMKAENSISGFQKPSALTRICHEEMGGIYLTWSADDKEPFACAVAGERKVYGVVNGRWGELYYHRPASNPISPMRK